MSSGSPGTPTHTRELPLASPEREDRASEPAARAYTTPHDQAIKRADWAMKEDPECAAAHRRRRAKRKELAEAEKREVPKARAALEAAEAEWRRITTIVFDRTMAEAGFPQKRTS